MKTLIRNAQAVVTVDAEDRVLHNANILIEDRVIRYIGTEPQPADQVIDASHCFVYPGLINTHHHLYQTFTRNLPQVQKMELFPWLVTLYEIWRGLDEDCIYDSSLIGIGELMRYGCTTCMDHHYVFPRTGSEHFIDQQFRAADTLGVRFHATRGSMSRGKSDGGLPPDDLVQDVDTNTDVAVYVKLPDSFFIATPVGHYNPDWAIAFYEGTVKHIYFVAETKGSMSSMQLRLIEESKIHCAREHFKAISNGNVVYDVVDSYQTLLEKVMR